MSRASALRAPIPHDFASNNGGGGPPSQHHSQKPAHSGFLEAPPRPRPSKRLILCEDGTWQNSDGNISQGGNAPPSNVVRLARAIRPMSRDGIPQVVNYHVGVGVSGGVLDKVYGGISGEGGFVDFLFLVLFVDDDRLRLRLFWVDGFL
jgi:hypothetical protein